MTQLQRPCRTKLTCLRIIALKKTRADVSSAPGAALHLVLQAQDPRGRPSRLQEDSHVAPGSTAVRPLCVNMNFCSLLTCLFPNASRLGV